MSRRARPAGSENTLQGSAFFFLSCSSLRDRAQPPLHTTALHARKSAASRAFSVLFSEGAHAASARRVSSSARY